MERFLKQYDKESMKMAILKQEETFRQQVHELHRLYRVQKLLMIDMKNTQNNHERWKVENETGSRQPCYSHRDEIRPRTIDLELPAEDYIGNEDGEVMLEIEQENELKLTLATGSRWIKREEASYISDSGASFSSSSTESGGVNSIGHEWGLLPVPNIQLSVLSERKSAFDVEERKRKERLKEPPWIFPCLSLKMT